MLNQEKMRKNCGNFGMDQGNKDSTPPPPPLLGNLTTSLAVCTYVLNSKSFGKVSTKSESE